MTDTASEIATALAKIGLAMKHSDQVAAGDEGLSPLQAQALSILTARTRGKPRGAGLRLTELAEELAVTQATISEAVRALADKRLVLKGADPEDGRALRLRPTAAGARLASRFDAWPELIRDLVGELSGEEREVLLRTLVRVVRGLVVRGAVPPQRMCVTCRYFRPDAHPGSPRRHHCAFLDEPLGDGDLRLDCPEQEQDRDPEARFQAFLRAAP